MRIYSLALCLCLIPTFAGAAVNSKAQRTSTSTSSVLNRPMALTPFIGTAVFSYADEKEAEFDRGIALGALLDVSLTSQMSLETGLMYLQAGAKGSQVAEGVKVDFTLTADYIAAPILAKVKLPQVQGLYVKGGLMPAILYAAEMEAKAPFRRVRVDMKSNMHEYDVFAVLGAGTRFPARPNMDITLDVTYNRGLINVVDEGDESAYNEGLVLMGGLTLNL